MAEEKHRKLTIAQLEELLEAEEEKEIEILPNGEIVVSGSSEKLNIKPLTYKEQLGGEYADL